MASVVDGGAVQSRGRGRARGRARILHQVHVESESRPGRPNFKKERENQGSAGSTEAACWGLSTTDVGHAQDVAWHASSCATAASISEFAKHSSSDARPEQPVLKHTQKEHRSRHDKSRFDNLITSQINQYLGQNNRSSRSALSSKNADCQVSTENDVDKCGRKGLSSSRRETLGDNMVASASPSPMRSNPQHLSHRCSPGLKLKMPSKLETEISEKFMDVKVDGRDLTSETREHSCAATVPLDRRGRDGVGALSQLSPPPESSFKGMHDTRGVSVASRRGRGRARGRGQGLGTEAMPPLGKTEDAAGVKCHNVVEGQFQDADFNAGGGGAMKNASRGNKILTSAGSHQIPVQTQRTSNIRTRREKNKNKIARAALEVIRNDGKSQVNVINSVSRISEDLSENSFETVDSLDVSTDALSPGLMRTPPGHVKVLDWAAEMTTPVSPKPSPDWSAGQEPVQSPDTLKTPPGHVKVLDWAAEMASPVSPSPCPNWDF